MTESRAKYLKDKWLAIDRCASCGSVCKLDGIQVCGELASINEFISDELDIRIPDIDDFNPDCPLPKWDNVRWHEMTQLPPSRKRVEVELEFARNAIREIRTGLLVGNGNTWAIDGIGLIYENETNIKLLRWRHVL